MNKLQYVLTFSYWIVSSLIGIVGNIFVLCLTKRYPGRMGVSVMTVTFLAYLAVSDLVFSITFLMIMINDIYLVESGRLNLSDLFLNYPLEYHSYSAVNRVVGSINIVSYTLSIVFILAISLHRIFIVMVPLKANVIKPYMMHVLAGICFLLISVHQLAMRIRSFEDNKCGIRAGYWIAELCPSDPSLKTIKFTELGMLDQFEMALFGVYAPIYLFQTLLNLILLVYAVRYSLEKRRSARRPLITTLSVAVVFIVSWTPFVVWTVYMFYCTYLVDRNMPIPPDTLSRLRWLEYTDYTLYSFSTYCNPIIYSLTIPKFRSAAKKQVLSWLGRDPTTRRTDSKKDESSKKGESGRNNKKDSSV